MIQAFQNNITITRGDDAKINIEITTTDDKVYTPADSDEITMYVKKVGLERPLEDQETIIEKKFNKEQIQVNEEQKDIWAATLDAADTANLELGTYKYGVKLKTVENKVHTIVTPSDFIISEGIEK